MRTTAQAKVYGINCFVPCLPAHLIPSVLKNFYKLWVRKSMNDWCFSVEVLGPLRLVAFSVPV